MTETTVTPHHTKRQNWASSEEPNNAKIERELAALRNANRLAVHMNEHVIRQDNKVCPYHVSERTLKLFNTPPQDIRQKLSESKIEAQDQPMPLLSMSLLPAGSKAIEVYVNHYSALNVNNYGYLVDLSQQQPHAAVVVGASDSNMESGSEPMEKKFLFKTWEFFPPADRKHYSDWIKICAGTKPLPPEVITPDHKNVTEQMLDKLGGYYARAGKMQALKLSNPQTFALNEIIVAASKEHIRAISIIMPDNSHDPQLLPAAQLVGALVGLQHLQQQPPIDLPVVLYHSEHKHGDITYVGQGEQELKKIALESISQLQQIADLSDKKFDQLKKAVSDVLAIDLNMPVDAQKASFSQRQFNSTPSSIEK